MKARKTHNLSIRIGEYTDAQGQTRGRFKNVGALFTREDGSMFLAVDSTIIAMETQYIANRNRDDKVMINIYPEDENRQQGGQQRQQSGTVGGYGGGGSGYGGGTGGGYNDLDDDIPYSVLRPVASRRT